MHQNTRRKSIEDLNITKGHEVMENMVYLILLFMHHTSLILPIQPNQKRFNLGVHSWQQELKERKL